MAAYGHIPGVPVQSLFTDRRALSAAGVHGPTQAGIWGSESKPAHSIVLSGGYEDDADLGPVIIYTGQGGQDPKTKMQIADQTLTRGNKSLQLSRLLGSPVRVIRGARHRSPYSPSSGYRYDGLYRVVDAWQDQGKSGFHVWRFRMEAEEIAPIEDVPVLVGNGEVAPRRVSTVSRIIRDSEKTRRVKRMYDHRCQVCGVRLEPAGIPYAEAAHIQPLGKPHDGPDDLDNILCLCPNHHVLFDFGGFSIADDLSLIGLNGMLSRLPKHPINPAYLAYHRRIHRKG